MRMLELPWTHPQSLLTLFRLLTDCEFHEVHFRSWSYYILLPTSSHKERLRTPFTRLVETRLISPTCPCHWQAEQLFQNVSINCMRASSFCQEPQFVTTIAICVTKCYSLSAMANVAAGKNRSHAGGQPGLVILVFITEHVVWSGSQIRIDVEGTTQLKNHLMRPTFDAIAVFLLKNSLIAGLMRCVLMATQQMSCQTSAVEECEERHATTCTYMHIHPVTSETR